MYLRQHRGEILKFWQDHGDELTMAEYNLNWKTIDNFLFESGVKARRRVHVNQLIDYRKVLDTARAARADAHAALQRVNDLTARGSESSSQRLEDNSGKLVLLAQIAEANATETSKKVKALEGQYQQFVELVADQVMRKFLIPLLRHAIEMPPELDKPLENTNDIDRLLESIKK